jgi:hypothetical protein
MTLDQFKFEKSHSLDFEEEARVKTNRDDMVILLRSGDWLTVRKIINGRVESECKFNEKLSEQGLTKYLKNIGKK